MPDGNSRRDHFAKEARDDVSPHTHHCDLGCNCERSEAICLKSVILNEVKNLVSCRLRSFVPQDDRTHTPSLEGGRGVGCVNFGANY